MEVIDYPANNGGATLLNRIDARAWNLILLSTSLPEYVRFLRWCILYPYGDLVIMFYFEVSLNVVRVRYVGIYLLKDEHE